MSGTVPITMLVLFNPHKTGASASTTQVSRDMSHVTADPPSFWLRLLFPAQSSCGMSYPAASPYPGSYTTNSNPCFSLCAGTNGPRFGDNQYKLLFSEFRRQRWKNLSEIRVLMLLGSGESLSPPEFQRTMSSLHRRGWGGRERFCVFSYKDTSFVIRVPFCFSYMWNVIVFHIHYWSKDYHWIFGVIYLNYLLVLLEV